MYIDPDTLEFHSEGDVEAKLLVPFLTGELYLNVPATNFYSKDYIAPSDLDKGAKVIKGYQPDFSVWLHAFPILIVEAKPPSAPVEQAYREAALYAQQRNMRYPTDLNPCRFLVASNGRTLLFGYWDCDPVLSLDITDIKYGSTKLDEVIDRFGIQALNTFAYDCLKQIKTNSIKSPFMLAGGHALLNARKPLNSFASELSPVLRRYFSSTASDVKEISDKAYVSSAEITEYDKVLESLLRDRASIRKDTIVEVLNPERHGEARVERAIGDFVSARPPEGQLQIIQGSVGAGKSLFIRRYQQVLQPESKKPLSLGLD